MVWALPSGIDQNIFPERRLPPRNNKGGERVDLAHFAADKRLWLAAFKGHLYSCFCFSYYFNLLSTGKKRAGVLGTFHFFSLLVESTTGLLDVEWGSAAGL